MHPIGEHIRAARESLNLTLEDIAATTRIQLKFLEAIEQGEFGFLPPTYARAFLRAYCKQVRLDPDEILRGVDSLSSQVAGEAASPIVSPTQHRDEAEVRKRPGRGIYSQHRVAAVFVVVLAAALFASLLIFDLGSDPVIVEEIPFQEIIRQQEHDMRATRAPGSGMDESVGPAVSVPEDSRRTLPPPVGDSLTLRALTFDSVWIRIVIDGKITEEFFAPPQWTGRWKAGREFLLSLDDAAAVSFTLNNVALGALGPPETPIRNKVVNAQLISGITRSIPSDARD